MQGAYNSGVSTTFGCLASLSCVLTGRQPRQSIGPILFFYLLSPSGLPTRTVGQRTLTCDALDSFVGVDPSPPVVIVISGENTRPFETNQFSQRGFDGREGILCCGPATAMCVSAVFSHVAFAASPMFLRRCRACLGAVSICSAPDAHATLLPLQSYPRSESFGSFQPVCTHTQSTYTSYTSPLAPRDAPNEAPALQPASKGSTCRYTHAC
jgi:hypothetical protein